jgi:hypothetical protein
MGSFRLDERMVSSQYRECRRDGLFTLAGRAPCLHLTPQPYFSTRRGALPLNSSSAPAPRPRAWPSAAASSSASPGPTSPLTFASPRNSTVAATPSKSGGTAISATASLASRTPHAPADPGAFPPSQRLDVIAIASSKPADHQVAATRYSLDDIAFTIVNEAHAEAISRATIGRILRDADLKPHRSVYWLNSHDPDFAVKAKAICELYRNAPAWYEQGRLVLSCDEKTGMQILDRVSPTQPARPGHPEKRENDYLRLGTRALIASFCVPTGEVVWDLGPTRTNCDFAHHVLRTAWHFRQMARFDWVVDNLNTHWSMELCRVVAYLCGLPFEPEALRTGAQRLAFLTDPSHKHVFHYLPRHGSWLNQVESGTRRVAACCPGSSSSVATLLPSRSLRSVCVPTWITIIRSKPIRIVGHTRASRWSGRRRSARHAGNSGRGEPGSVLGANALSA